MAKSNKKQIKEELTEMLRELHLPTVRAEFEATARQAENLSYSFEQYLADLVRRECEERRVNRIDGESPLTVCFLTRFARSQP